MINLVRVGTPHPVHLSCVDGSCTLLIPKKDVATVEALKGVMLHEGAADCWVLSCAISRKLMVINKDGALINESGILSGCWAKVGLSVADDGATVDIIKVIRKG